MCRQRPAHRPRAPEGLDYPESPPRLPEASVACQDRLGAQICATTAPRGAPDITSLASKWLFVCVIRFVLFAMELQSRYVVDTQYWMREQMGG